MNEFKRKIITCKSMVPFLLIYSVCFFSNATYVPLKHIRSRFR